jgi:hypothetical protein
MEASELNERDRGGIDYLFHGNDRLITGLMMRKTVTIDNHQSNKNQEKGGDDPPLTKNASTLVAQASINRP